MSEKVELSCIHGSHITDGLLAFIRHRVHHVALFFELLPVVSSVCVATPYCAWWYSYGWLFIRSASMDLVTNRGGVPGHVARGAWTILGAAGSWMVGFRPRTRVIVAVVHQLLAAYFVPIAWSWWPTAAALSFTRCSAPCMNRFGPS